MITETVLLFAVLFFILSLLGVRTALGATGTAGKFSPFETSRIYPEVSGILYPGIPSAAGINPAALVSPKKVTAVQAAYTPSLRGGDPQEFFGAFGYSNRSFGFGLGYDGVKPDGGTLQNGVYAGAGFGIDKFSAGFAIRQADLRGNFDPDVDLAMKFGLDDGWSIGAVIYHVDSPARLDAGVGFAKKDYSVEGNVLLPTFSGWNGGYAFTGSVNVFPGQTFGMHFRTTYFTEGRWFSHTVGISANVSAAANVLVQYTTDRTLAVALTLFL